jgi:hypothetical protein
LIMIHNQVILIKLSIVEEVTPLVFKPLAWRVFLKELRKRNLDIRKTSWDWTVYDNGEMLATVARNHPGEDYLKPQSRQNLNRELKRKGIKEI